MAGEALQEVFARFGVKFDTKELVKGQAAIRNSIGSLQKFGQIIAGAMVIRSIARFISNTRAIGDELDKTSIQIGLTTKELQAYRFAANLGGVSSQVFSNSLGQLQRRAVDAAENGGRAAEVFRNLGITVKEQNGEMKTGSMLLEDVAEAIKNTENPTQRTAFAMELMGRSGRQMLPVLQGGREALADMRREAEALGGGMSEEAIAASVKLTDDITKMQLALEGIRGRIALVVLPVISKFTVAMTKISAVIVRVTENSHIFELALVALGVVASAVAIKIALTWGAAFAPLILAALAVAIVLIAFEDLWATFEGKDTMLQSLIDEMVGFGTTQKIIENQQQGWIDLKWAMSEAWITLSRVLDNLIQGWIDLNSFIDTASDLVGKFISWVDSIPMDPIKYHLDLLIILFDAVIEGWGEVWSQMSKANALTSMITDLQLAWQTLTSDITAAADAISKFASGPIDAIKGMLGIEAPPTTQTSRPQRSRSPASPTTQETPTGFWEWEWPNPNVMASSVSTQQTVSPANIRGNTTVTQAPTINTTVHAHGPDATDVAREVEQTVFDRLDRENRQTLVTLEAAEVI